MRIIKGTNRIVLLIGKQAIKIPNIVNGHLLFLYGCYSNYNERSFCKKFKCIPELYNKVCPSLFCSWFGLLEIQYRCIPISSISEVELNRLSCINGESKPSNYGIFKGKIVCVDYAN